jgi:hypothetical protein
MLPRCGDGIVDPGRGEGCEPPDLENTGCTGECKLVVCPALNFEAGDVAITNGGTYPSTATYACEGGGPPSDGDAVLTCLPTGEWSGTAPTQCGIRLHFKLWGAGGGGNYYKDDSSHHAEGGAGGFIEGDYLAQPGEVLTITVGGGGQSRQSGDWHETPGTPNGGNGGLSMASGGGSTHVQSNLRDDEVILGAGGGGGAAGGASSGGGGGGGGTCDGTVGHGGGGCSPNGPKCQDASDSDFNGIAGGGGGGMGTRNGRARSTTEGGGGIGGQDASPAESANGAGGTTGNPDGGGGGGGGAASSKYAEADTVRAVDATDSHPVNTADEDFTNDAGKGGSNTVSAGSPEQHSTGSNGLAVVRHSDGTTSVYDTQGSSVITV